MKKYSNQMQQRERVMEPETIQKNGVSPKNHRSRRKIKSFTLLAFIVFFGFRAMAQDVIVLKNSDEIKALVQEVGTEYVKYKKFDNQSGPVYNVAISEIFMIKYENGSKDVFTNSTVPTAKTPSTPIVEQQNTQNQVETTFEPLTIQLGQICNRYGVKQSKDEIRNMMRNVPEAKELYDNGNNQRVVGQVFGGVAFGCLAGGLIQLFATPTDENGKLNNNSYLYWYGGVVVSAIPAFIIIHSANKKIEKSVDVYNRVINHNHTSNLSLNFGATRSGGIGFTLNF